ncbi:MAG: hypothetical protein MK137_01915 [Rickettsiales bacterium]|nr:hypothetical protein [Rickettsiales bacterium]
MPSHMQSIKKDRSPSEMKAYLRRCEKDQAFWNTQNGSQKAAARSSWELYFPGKPLPDSMGLTVQVRSKKDIEAELIEMLDNPKKWGKLKDAKKKSEIRSAWDRAYKGVALPVHMRPKAKSKVSDVRAKLIIYERDPAEWDKLDRFQKNNMRVAWQDTHFKTRSLPKHMMKKTSKRPEQLQEYAQDEAKWKALKPPMRSKLRNDWDKYFPNEDMPPHMQSMTQSGASKVAAKPRARAFSR